MKNPLLEVIERRKAGALVGVPSFCTANELAIEALLRWPDEDFVLIEGTSNQMNQFGGYTGMTPRDFRDYVYSIAGRTYFNKEKLLLGADHVGPLPWADRPAAEAMENAKELVRLCVLAGFKKIHLDTSMRLGDDPEDKRLSDDTVAERGAELLTACEAAYQELLRDNPGEMRPVYVIGSEVPIPGGAQEGEGLKVTGARDLEATLAAYRRAFAARSLEERWGDVIAVVVQPGVEFGDRDIHHYSRAEAAKLCAALRGKDLVFEGHSTDYQAPHHLREMVEDGIAILKVGPALTFALREGLFALSRMEKELVPDGEQARFMETLAAAMEANPKHWRKYYHGSSQEIRLAQRYSFSDRSRYYLGLPEVKAAMEKLFHNIDNADVPMGMLSQYMPQQYEWARDGALPMKARELVKNCVVLRSIDYSYAAHG